MDTAQLWGLLVTTWIVLCIPSYIVATIATYRKASPEEEKRREDASTRLGLWWAAGLVFLLVAWKAGLDPVWSGIALAIYVVSSVAIRVRSRKKKV